ncbi:B-cell receptor CD22 isoform X2 [Labeo rohita]|nr:B-cell receptor CD22 isoform X2 [Labeo rohita]
MIDGFIVLGFFSSSSSFYASLLESNHIVCTRVKGVLKRVLISNIHSGHTEERPQGKVTIKPDQHVFRGETVTLRCDIDGEGVTSWQYSWYKDGSASVSSKLQEHTFWFVSKSDAGKYSCYGAERGGSRRSQHSDEVTLTVSDRAQAVLSVSPQKWLTEGDPVTLICEVNGSSTGWTFSWYTETVLSAALRQQQRSWRKLHCQFCCSKTHRSLCVWSRERRTSLLHSLQQHTVNMGH